MSRVMSVATYSCLLFLGLELSALSLGVFSGVERFSTRNMPKVRGICVWINVGILRMFYDCYYYRCKPPG